MKIIIWGWPLYSHTFSYINEAFYRAFQYLGHETYWFHDGEFPENFDWSNCVFWTEGFCESNIPLHSESVYFVHGCADPKKYIDVNVKRFIDVRYNYKQLNDHIYNYAFDRDKSKEVGPVCYFEPRTNTTIHYKNNYREYDCSDYDKFYITWAANKLPNEFDENDMFIPKERAIYYCGTLGSQGVNENMSVYGPFIAECHKQGVQFVHNDPWVNPLPDAEVIARSQKSILGIDLRGPEHLRNGLLPCRVFKMMSYGQLGLTNSPDVYEQLEEHCVFESDPVLLYHKGMLERTNYAKIKQGMEFVKENHTYVNRAKALLSILENVV